MIISQPAIDRGFFDHIAVKNLVSRYNPSAPDWGETGCRYTYNKFYYIMAGEGEIIIGDDHFHLQPGHLYLIPAQTAHTCRHNPERPIVKYWCHFHLNLGEERTLVYNRRTLSCRLPGEIGIPVFRQLIQASGSGDPLDILLENAALLQLLHLFLSRVELQEILPAAGNDLAVRLKEHISRHFLEKITLGRLASVAHMHPNYLVKYFRKHFSDTPINYVNGLRLHLAARQLIHRPDTPVKSIASDAGFRDYHYFTRLFKRKFGITPSGYRSTGRPE